MRQGYQGVAVAVPVTVPYVRYSIRAAHWWLAKALSEIIDRSGLKKDDIDGLSVASFTLAPDTAIGLTQHLGLSVRWLDHVAIRGRLLVDQGQGGLDRSFGHDVEIALHEDRGAGQRTEPRE